MFVLCRPQTQIHDLKQAQNPSSIQLRSTLLDPAVNLLFQRMKTDLDSEKEKLEQAQNDLSAWKFTPDRWWKFSRTQLLVARTQQRIKVNWTRSSHKILFVCPMVSDSRLPEFMHWRTVDYICSRGNNCLFRLEYLLQELMEHTFLTVLFSRQLNSSYWRFAGNNFGSARFISDWTMRMGLCSDTAEHLRRNSTCSPDCTVKSEKKSF